MGPGRPVQLRARLRGPQDVGRTLDRAGDLNSAISLDACSDMSGTDVCGAASTIGRMASTDVCAAACRIRSCSVAGRFLSVGQRSTTPGGLRCPTLRLIKSVFDTRCPVRIRPCLMVSWRVAAGRCSTRRRRSRWERAGRAALPPSPLKVPSPRRCDAVLGRS